MALINIEHRNAINSIIDIKKDLIKNPYYLFNDSKITIVDYYNISVDKSILDESTRLTYANIGENSSLKFNLIHNMYFFGVDRIMIGLENGDYGLESSEITGDGYVLPNTIQPYPGDYFSITYVNKKYLFRINSVSNDTLQDGANIWKCEYKLDQLSDKSLLPLVVDEFEFLVKNVGTKFNPIVTKGKYDVALKLDEFSTYLKKFYKSMYYNEKVQTFTVLHLDIDPEGCFGQVQKYFYDPYLIEFIIENKVLDNDGDEYMYITHQTRRNSDFVINYTKSIWKILSDCDMNNLPSCIITSDVEYIDDNMTIFQTRYEDYFALSYRNLLMKDKVATILNPIIIDNILTNTLFEDDAYLKYNILVKYFNEESISIGDIIPFDKIQYLDSFKEEYYFLLPMVIFCIDFYIKKMIS